MAKKVVITPLPKIDGSLNMTVIGCVIRHKRTTLGMTLVDAAALSNLSKQTYQNIEKGHATVKVESLLKACMTLGVKLTIIADSEEQADDEWI
ncbi:hypothetical protein MNBD_GAMMA04-2286 [hydrothermal vent metagenome]|uniref:HTH cro/C1-type domain-containing protein n=1 Tax=hydrothermal vent metagenome TaxID=652676 RepID=A0A3B0VTB9_9ZZZZ